LKYQTEVVKVVMLHACELKRTLRLCLGVWRGREGRVLEGKIEKSFKKIECFCRE